MGFGHGWFGGGFRWRLGLATVVDLAAGVADFSLYLVWVSHSVILVVAVVGCRDGGCCG